MSPNLTYFWPLSYVLLCPTRFWPLAICTFLVYEVSLLPCDTNKQVISKMLYLDARLWRSIAEVSAKGMKPKEWTSYCRSYRYSYCDTGIEFVLTYVINNLTTYLLTFPNSSTAKQITCMWWALAVHSLAGHARRQNQSVRQSFGDRRSRRWLVPARLTDVTADDSWPKEPKVAGSNPSWTRATLVSSHPQVT